MSTTPKLRVLFFDVFGTCVRQREPVGNALWTAAREALESDVSTISSEVRAKAKEMVSLNWLSIHLNYRLIFLQTYEQWFEFGGVSDLTK